MVGAASSAVFDGAVTNDRDVCAGGTPKPEAGEARAATAIAAGAMRTIVQFSCSNVLLFCVIP
eukprot:CAMPEP_0183291530 /NCGR_PEP_ID=MMETSP0160_2-20130417/918_1 /TAXON_ID=2839 ORGANISM="Odontella Sinensis, Strain Grunow 1884" /NCGR_SAMPLE_ID=MMETSP0160_2 /ASSEMBLY_ACC=CAM_ASM_000250 /LENGTH=62 /DNA_ID=CAMNT_0025452351 /DNA_START=442 /DNA_END=627 /DNA_ORIENTATION=+